MPTYGKSAFTPDEMVQNMQSAMENGGHDIGQILAHFRDMTEIDPRPWLRFRDVLGFERANRSFVEFVEAKRPQGLGITVDFLRKITALDVEAETRLRNEIDVGVQNPSGLHSGVDNINARPTGTGKDQALRRLRKDAPELHAEVLADRLSANAAMVQAGLRPRTFTVRADRAESIAATLRRQLDADTLRSVVEIIGTDT